MNTESGCLSIFAALLVVGCAADGTEGSKNAPVIPDQWPVECPWVVPVLTTEISENIVASACGDGCRPMLASPPNSASGYFVACVAEALPELTDSAEYCFRSPVDRCEYVFPNSGEAGAVMSVCWVPCSVTGADDPGYQNWLNEIGSQWEDCRVVWER